jgi:hypothetical protein
LINGLTQVRSGTVGSHGQLDWVIINRLCRSRLLSEVEITSPNPGWSVQDLGIIRCWTDELRNSRSRLSTFPVLLILIGEVVFRPTMTPLDHYFYCFE